MKVPNLELHELLIFGRHLTTEEEGRGKERRGEERKEGERKGK
jgi:hypothetical protein